MITTEPVSQVEILLEYIEEGKSLEEFFADFPVIALSEPEPSRQPAAARGHESRS